MKERPDRAKCPRRLALPNCSVPRPSGGFHPSLGSEHAPAATPLFQPSPPPILTVFSLSLPLRLARQRFFTNGKMAWPTKLMGGRDLRHAGCCATWWDISTPLPLRHIDITICHLPSLLPPPSFPSPAFPLPPSSHYHLTISRLYYQQNQ